MELKSRASAGLHSLRRLWGESTSLPFQLLNESISGSVVSDSLWPYGLQPTRLLCPWDSPGKNTGVGSHFLLQGIFLTQGSNLGLLYCRQSLPCLSHQGRPEKLEAAFFGSWPFPPSSKHIISISAFAIASTFFSDLWLLWAYLDNPGLFSHFKILNQICLRCLLPYRGFPGSSEDKVSACNAGDPGSIPELGRSPGEGNGTPLQYSCLENPMDGEAW